MFSERSGISGFSLLEVLVAMLVASIVIGGVMGSLSSSMALKRRGSEKMERWSRMETALMDMLANPQRVMAVGERHWAEETGIKVEKRLVSETEAGELSPKNSHLVRVRMYLEGEMAELSIMVPAEFDAPDGAVALPTIKSSAQIQDYDEPAGADEIIEAGLETGERWQEVSSVKRISSTQSDVSGGYPSTRDSTLVASLGEAPRPSMSGGGSRGWGMGGWADSGGGANEQAAVEKEVVDDATDAVNDEQAEDTQSQEGQEQAADEDSNTGGQDNDSGGSGGGQQADNDDEAKEDPKKNMPPDVNPGGKWIVAVKISDENYIMMNEDTGARLHIYRGGIYEYRRWKKVWLNW